MNDISIGRGTIFKIIYSILLIYFLNDSYENFQVFDSADTEYRKNLSKLDKQKIEYESALKSEKEKNISVLKTIVKYKINIDETEVIVQNEIDLLNTINGIKAQLVQVKSHDRFINVALAQVRVESTYKNLRLVDFEDVFKKRFNSFSNPIIKHSRDKKDKADIYLVILKKGE